MTYEPIKGHSFLIPSGPAEDGKHLYVLLTDRCAQGTHLAISITSLDTSKYYDPTCILKQGEHPFIKHSIWVAYHKSEIFTSESIVAEVARFTYMMKEPASSELVEKMAAGISKSKRATPKIRAYYATNQSNQTPQAV